MGTKQENLDLQLAKLHKQLLQHKLDDVTRLLGLTGLGSAWVVTPDEFHRALERCDVALDALSGVTRESRRLVWLNEVLESTAAEMKGRPWVESEELRIPLRALARFAQQSLAEIPPPPRARSAPNGKASKLKEAGIREDLVVVRFLGQYLAACAAAARPGRPHRGKRVIPEKWIAFRELADHLGLVSATTSVDTLRRTVLRAKRKLKSAAQLHPKA